MGLDATVFISPAQFARRNPSVPFTIDEETGQVTLEGEFIAQIPNSELIAERQWLGNSALMGEIREEVETRGEAFPQITRIINSGSGWVITLSEVPTLKAELESFYFTDSSESVLMFLGKLKRLVDAALDQSNPIAM